MLLQSSYDIQWEPVSDPFEALYLDQNQIWPLEFTSTRPWHIRLQDRTWHKPYTGQFKVLIEGPELQIAVSDSLSYLRLMWLTKGYFKG